MSMLPNVLTVVVGAAIPIGLLAIMVWLRSRQLTDRAMNRKQQWVSNRRRRANRPRGTLSWMLDTVARYPAPRDGIVSAPRQCAHCGHVNNRPSFLCARCGRRLTAR